MYKTLLNNEIEKLKSKGIPYNIESGKFDLADMQEKASGKPYIDLENSILIVKKIVFYGVFNVSLWNASTTFLQLISAYQNIDYSNLIEVSQTTPFVTVKSEFASVHEVRFLMRYNLTTFIESDPANIFKASLEYIKIHKLEQK
ncbi:MAG: hypothetical protein L3J35_03675 [Bacteroidales bacterium]|nr:hypothetical protein [Bacteroidales bacterium]